jgi:PAS domain S-box-containing protein
MAISTSWDYRLVVLSVVLAIFGSYAALDFAGRMRSSVGRSRKLWFAGGAALMGLAIWSMHFVGMLALDLHIPVSYDMTLSGLSLLAAVVGAGIAFTLINQQTLGRLQFVAGSIAMGLAIAGMHYIGMASMRMDARIHYNGPLFALSVLIAVAAAAGAMWLAFRLKRDRPSLWFYKKVGSALVMGVAIAGMHYMGMAAATYEYLGGGSLGVLVPPTVGGVRLSDLMIVAGILFGFVLILLSSRNAAERLRAMNALEDSEDGYRLLVDSVQDYAIYRLDAEGKIITWNSGAERVFGYTAEEVLGRDCSIFMPESDEREGRVAYLLETAVREGKVQDESCRCRKGARVFSADVLITPLYKAGKLLGFSNITRDVTERKQAIARKAAILESSLDAIVILDSEGKILEWNRGAERIFGYVYDEAAGQDIIGFIIPERHRALLQMDIARYLETGGRANENNVRIELEAVRADGSELPVELTVVPVNMDGPAFFTWMLRDITERKRAKEELEKLVEERTLELQKNSRLLNSIIENVPAMVFLKDAKDLKFRLVNKAAEQVIGYPAQELLGKSDYDFFPKEQADFFTAKDHETLNSKHLVDIAEEPIQRRTGETHYLYTKKVPILDDDGSPQFLLGISEDITEAKQSKEYIEHLNSQLEGQIHTLNGLNKELETFSYSVSHDLRAPLRTIDGFSQAVLEMYSDKLDDRGRDYLGRVRQGSQQMGQLIDDMLKLSRLTRGDLNLESDIDLSEMARDFADELRKREPERQVTFDIENGLLVRGDRRLLQAMIENLLDNSWKYTSKHPAAHIEVGKLESVAVYYVKDDGAGFDMAYADKLFGAFQRLHTGSEFPGTGVGLATAARIVHRHGGEIWAEGEVEKGATFYFTLEPVNLEEKVHVQSGQGDLAGRG